jgi:hypothetical protein
MVIEWQNTTDPLPDRMICGAEILFGVTFPGDYRECLRINHGGHPNHGDFTVRGVTSSWVSCIGVLLSLDWRRPSNVWDVLASLAAERQLPEGVFPVSDDGGGDLLCLDFRGRPSDPVVVYWSHEVGGEDGVVPVAENFSELLTLLRAATR